MPMITVEMFSGRTKEQKQKLVQALTQAFVDTAGGTAESVQIILSDIDKDNWAVAGKLYSEPNTE